MKNNEAYVIGVDYGTASVRSILVNANNGTIITEAEYEYPRWKKGLYCNPSKNQFRQHPLDYLEGLEYTIKTIVANTPPEIVAQIKALSLGTTGSTPIAVCEKGIPLALHDEFSENPNAMFFLWKDHTAKKEADEINAHGEKFETKYLQYSGGIYSSEWFWAKLLHALRMDTKVRKACVSWVEHCDWLPFLLTGGNDYKKIKRSVCAAGHKALWADEHGGLPPKDFFTSLDAVFTALEHPLFSEVYTTDKLAGNLCAEWAGKLGLSENVKIGIGALDAHLGAVGGQIEPGYLSKVMGTSTCDMLVIPKSKINNKVVSGISGQVDGSILPEMIGFEAGQSAFGDVYDWFKKLLTETIIKYILDSDIDKSSKQQLIKEIETNILKKLGEEANQLPFDENSELAIDWFNGRRTPNANLYLRGAIFNLNLGSDAPRVYRSLVEATCFGSKKIIDHFIEQGVQINGIIALGGVAKKSGFVMQMMADVLSTSIKVNTSEQTCALGAAMFASVIAGVHKNVTTAVSSMGHGFDKIYKPDETKSEIYNKRYQKYKKAGIFLDFKN
ncbi:ribulokinase [uncultured Polaribacter sp.]|uniref:ribulokinase n=1 Tax=uncultured Polaribacter sp. TaxID=174711 RepID=UPI002635DA56|nr:ribulokinase [uncultured Polaribacter sp.]